VNRGAVLRLVLIVSIILIVAGVIRCSVELTPPGQDAGGTEQAEQR
jgi:hypothetical protein